MRTRISMLVLMAFFEASVVASLSADDVPLVLKALSGGRAIFGHVWQAGEPASPGGDGLGPVHNDVSCVACHSQGGIGGSGGIEKNATLLTLTPKPTGMSSRLFLKRAEQIHPGLLDDFGKLKPTLVLHKFSTDVEYNVNRQRFVGLEMPLAVSDELRVPAERLVASVPVRTVQHGSGLRVLLSQRNSPALFGAGLIDRVPDQLLRRLSRLQEKRGIVSGRVSPVSGRAGKFGWKAQTASLSEFVRDACANELGLQVPGADQAMHPQHRGYKPKGLDLNAAQLTSLTMFVSALAPPQVEAPGDDALLEQAKRGRKLFAKTGCAECHVESLGSSVSAIHGIFSDLLLHDMGPSLADPVKANPKLMEVKVPLNNSSLTAGPSGSSSGSSGGGGSYGGGGGSSSGSSVSRSPGSQTVTVNRVVPTNQTQEWRTPPLWGLSASAPYLHDGRASTVTEAILYHGGEAKFSVKRFLSLPIEDRVALLEFLNTLVPPAVDEA